MQTQYEFLEQAQEHIEEAITLIRKANFGSLKDRHSYNFRLMTQELTKISDNSAGYLTRDTNLAQILEEEGEDWQNENVEE